MKKILVIFLITFTTLSFAQMATVKGLVKQDKNNEPLIGVNVSVQNSSVGTTTDLDGKYELKLSPGDYTLIFTYVGFEDKKDSFKLKDGETKELNIVFSENNNLLNTVVVSGSRYEKKLSEEIFVLQKKIFEILTKK